MKKYINLFVIMLLLATMCLNGVSCGGNANDSDSEEAVTTTMNTDDVDKKTADGNDSDYVLQYRDGKNYLVFDDISKYTSLASDGEYIMEVEGVTFESMKDFKDTVVGGKLTDAQKVAVSQFKKDETGNIMTPDFNNLYVPVLPSGCTTIGGVYWNNGGYAFSIENEKKVYVDMVMIATEECYNSIYTERYNRISSDNKMIKITKTEELDGGKTAIYYTTDVGEFMQLTYTLTSGNKTCTVFKKYALDIHDISLKDDIPTSSTVPETISLFFVENGHYYMTNYIKPHGEDVDDSFFMSFGITRYIEETNLEVK